MRLRNLTDNRTKYFLPTAPNPFVLAHECFEWKVRHCTRPKLYWNHTKDRSERKKVRSSSSAGTVLCSYLRLCSCTDIWIGAIHRPRRHPIVSCERTSNHQPKGKKRTNDIMFTTGGSTHSVWWLNDTKHWAVQEPPGPLLDFGIGNQPRLTKFVVTNDHRLLGNGSTGKSCNSFIRFYIDNSDCNCTPTIARHPRGRRMNRSKIIHFSQSGIWRC